MNKKDKLFPLRNTQWQALCEKYEKRGKINTAECYFGEVNYKLFAKSKLKPKRKTNKKVNKKFRENRLNDRSNNVESNTENTLDVDISDIIDDDVYEIPSKVCSETNNNSQERSITTLKENNRTSSLIKHNTMNGTSPIVKNNYVSILQNWPSVDTKKSKNDNTIEGLNKNDFIASSQSYTPVKVNKQNNVKHPSDKENCDAETPSSLVDLVHFIEIDLRSPLREMSSCRSESKILETDDYSYWHDCTKKEMKRLRKYISRDELKEYMRYCNNEVNLTLVRDQISKSAKSNLQELLIKREFTRGNKEKYLKYCNRIHDEWQKLILEVPLEDMILYASCVVNSVKEGKQKCSLSYQNQSHKGNTVEFRKESIDSGFITI